MKKSPVLSAAGLLVIALSVSGVALAQGKSKSTTRAAAAPVAPRLDLTKPEDAVKAFRKLQASLVDGKPAIFWFQGNVYSRVAGEPDKHLVSYQAFNIRATHAAPDVGRGYGFRLVSKELLLYMDPGTGEVLRTWKNPWTNKDVEVVHVANDPVNQRPMYAQSDRGPFKFTGTVKQGTVIQSAEVPLFYTNPMGGDYQQYVGGTYQAIELFNFYAPEDELLGSPDGAENAAVSWARVSQWLPWMEMGGRAGWLIFNGAGRRISTFDALPEVVKREVEANYPAYKTPPPGDDQRPNETSWTYFKKRMDAKKK
jgi:hypothetical protein